MAVALLLAIVALLALKSNENVRALMKDLTGENKVLFARQFYNDIATRYNTVQQVFPTDLFTVAFRLKNAERSEITNEVDREAPAVELSRK